MDEPEEKLSKTFGLRIGETEHQRFVKLPRMRRRKIREAVRSFLGKLLK